QFNEMVTHSGEPNELPNRCYRPDPSLELIGRHAARHERTFYRALHELQRIRRKTPPPAQPSRDSNGAVPLRPASAPNPDCLRSHTPKPPIPLTSPADLIPGVSPGMQPEQPNSIIK